MKRTLLFILVCGLAWPGLTGIVRRAQAQEPVENRGAAAAWQSLQRLRSTATVLHTTAHPDDEDAALLTWLTRGQGVRTGLLTLNRGEGGANEVGPELYDGQNNSANNCQIDGVDNNEPLLGLVVQIPPAEAIQQFSVSTSNYDAEFGRPLTQPILGLLPLCDVPEHQHDTGDFALLIADRCGAIVRNYFTQMASFGLPILEVV